MVTPPTHNARACALPSGSGLVRRGVRRVGRARGPFCMVLPFNARDGACGRISPLDARLCWKQEGFSLHDVPLLHQQQGLAIRMAFQNKSAY